MYCPLVSVRLPDVLHSVKPPPKKYYMVVMLVEVTTVEKLIDRLQKGKYRSNTEILAKSGSRFHCPARNWTLTIFLVQEKVDDEDDIVAGHQKMSLKCPVGCPRVRLLDCSIHIALSVELHGYYDTMSFTNMCASSMF